MLQVDLHGLHVEEALQVLEQHLFSLGGLGCPGGVLLQVLLQICLPLRSCQKHSANHAVIALTCIVSMVLGSALLVRAQAVQRCLSGQSNTRLQNLQAIQSGDLVSKILLSC